MPLYMIDCHLLPLHESSKVNHFITFPRLWVTVTNWWIECYHPAHLQLTICMCFPYLARLWHPSASRNLLDHGLQVHLQPCAIIASKFAVSWHQSPYLKCISESTRSRLQSASPNSLDYSLQVDLQTSSITASECISEFTWLSSSDAPRIALKRSVFAVQIFCV